MSQIVSLPRPDMCQLWSRSPATVAASASLSSSRPKSANPHTRRVYARAVAEFLAWCESAGVTSLPDVQPLHVVRAGSSSKPARSLPPPPSVKQRLAALRHLYDWLATGQVVPTNPAASARGPRHVVRSAKTSVLEPVEARRLL
jgi:site-specific recombinase XerC